jgi:hypothetical protein
MNKQVHKAARPIVVGALVAMLGPLLGFAAVLAWVLLDRGVDAALYLTRFPDLIVTPYMFGALPAAVAGLVAGWRVWRHGAISLRFWLAATGIIALLPSLAFLAWSTSSPIAALYVTDEEIAAMYIAATVFASLALRLLLTATGLLRWPSEA